MKFAVIDTETSGLFDFKLPADASGQPRLAHFCMVLTDENLQETKTVDLLVKPEGWVMSAEAMAVNNLTMEYLLRCGQPVAESLDAYEIAISMGFTIAAFNVAYDAKIMRGELRRAGRSDIYEQTPTFCVMRAAQKVIGGKVPSLARACEHFGIPQTAAHTALDDARCALRVMQKMRVPGVVQEAAAVPSPTKNSDWFDKEASNPNIIKL